MKKNIRLYILSLILMFLCGINAVWALPQSFEVKSYTSSQNLPETHTKPTDCSDSECYGTTLKFYEESNEKTGVFCTLFEAPSPAWKGVICNITEQWSDPIRYAVGSVVESVKPSIEFSQITNNKENIMHTYLSAEMALNKFLYDVGKNKDDVGGWDISTSKISRNLNSQYETYLNEANSAYTTYNNMLNSTITFNASYLVFSLDSEGKNYISNTVEMNYGAGYIVESNIGTVSRHYNMFSVSVPKDEINEDTTVTVTVTVKQKYGYARRYYCGDEYQPVTPIALEYSTVTKKNSISGEIKRETPKGKLIIEKKDTDTNEQIPGAIIAVTGPNRFALTFTSSDKPYEINGLEYGDYTITEMRAPSGYVISEGTKTVTIGESTQSVTVTLKNNKNKVKFIKTDEKGNPLAGATFEIQNLLGAVVSYCGENRTSFCRWTSTTDPYEVSGLPAGTYYFTETSAPKGYVLNSNKIRFTVGNDGKVSVNGINKEDLTLKLSDELIKIIISKTDITGKKELPGATLEIQDEKGNVVNYCGENRISACRWTSTTKPYEIEGIPVGTYYLVETAAPEGYALKKEKVKFTVKADGYVRTVTMTNSLTSIRFSKTDITGKKELAGATLEIQDEEGNVVNYCMDLKGNYNTACKWVSTGDPYQIDGLPTGTYYLVETIAPKGYILNKERVQFTVTDDGVIRTVVMKNNIRKLKITKYDSTGVRELKGATLELQDEEGYVVNYCKGQDGNNTACRWVSTDKPYEIEGLPVGVYYLVEVEAPEGYILNTEKKKIEITEDDVTIEVGMTNELKVDVPDTLSSKSALLLAISMFDIALGMGIITYVKKNRIEE